MDITYQAMRHTIEDILFESGYYDVPTTPSEGSRPIGTAVSERSLFSAGSVRRRPRPVVLEERLAMDDEAPTPVKSKGAEVPTTAPV
mmetsp:Transcript_71207/g.167854  ORF Transcript_71207/g.167854 Transcript_71207/m.167854 type:complete len:87 (+) Transcript_71207:75-335(+)